MVHAHWMETKVTKRNSGGAARRNVAYSSPGTQVHGGTGLLWFTCSVCFILSLICTCLATLLVLLDQRVEAVSYQYCESLLNAFYTYIRVYPSSATFVMIINALICYYEYFARDSASTAHAHLNVLGCVLIIKRRYT